MNEGQLKRSALGRVAFIGELYDARTETFTHRSLLKKPFPPHLIEHLDNSHMEMDYKFTKNLSDRFELLNVEAELQMNVLCGLVSVGGSGRFLKEESKSNKTVACTFICNIHTVSEKFFSCFTELLPYIDVSALEDTQGTHLVTEVNWGANFLLRLMANTTEECFEQKIEGALKGELSALKSFLTIKGDGGLEKKDFESKTTDEINVSVYADIVPDGKMPTSVEGFCKFVKEVPDLLKKVNNGKGKPLSYVMIPLHTIKKVAGLHSSIEIVVRKFDESFLMSTVFFFEHVSELKRNFFDLLEEMKKMSKYLEEDDLKTERRHQETLEMKESELKRIISEDWVEIKSGTKNLNDLVRKVERFKCRDLNLNFYEECLNSASVILKKLAMIKSLTALNVEYLGRGDDFNVIMSQNINSEFVVLVMSSEIEKENPELFRNTLHYFQTEAKEARLNTKYVVMDFDYSDKKSFMNVSTLSCIHLKGSQILSYDMFGDYIRELTTAFARLKSGKMAEYIRHKPGNRVPLEMICPNFQMANCSTGKLSWFCFRCKSNIEYGFDRFFYCSCGRGAVADFEYRCSDPKHGNIFTEANADVIDKILSSLRPLPDMNVLILGQSGVGKSTWINSIVNYLNFESLENAQKHGVICTIPTSFPMYDKKTNKKHIITIGEDQNEVVDVGSSATQNAHTYNLLWQGKCVRIIDTPGLGDTRGIEQDKLNLKNIIHHIGYLKELHGVCILLRANDNRIHSLFSYCLKELLSHLHKSITKNIVFCFTNARNSFYTPGQTSALLEKLINDLGAEDLQMGYHNMFCLDNEAFLFLCSLQNPEIQYDDMLKQSFNQSWDMSLKETTRLFNAIASFAPHPLEETLSLVKARNRIMNLSKPIAEISKTIEMNVTVIERKKEEVKTSNLTVNELSKQLKFTEIQLEPVSLHHPRTVCTNSSCVEYVPLKNSDISQVLYKTHCHPHCGLTGVPQSVLNNSLLTRCVAMDSNGYCRVCGCGWQKHMHIAYEQNRVEKEVINVHVKEIIDKEKSEKDRLEALMKQLSDKIDEYREEQKIVVQASVKFGTFLRRNAIAVYNDSVADYLKYLIEEEKNKPYKSKTEENLLSSLETMLEHYYAEVEVLEEVLKKGESMQGELGAKEVLELEQELYALPLTGKLIKESVACSQSANKNMSYRETALHISKPYFKSKSSNYEGPKVEKSLMKRLYEVAISRGKNSGTDKKLSESLSGSPFIP